MTAMLSRVADAVFAEMDDRGLFNGVGSDLFDEIKEAVARAAVTALLEPNHTMIVASRNALRRHIDKTPVEQRVWPKVKRHGGDVYMIPVSEKHAARHRAIIKSILHESEI